MADLLPFLTPLLLVVWGLAVKHWPALAPLPNAAINWLNLVLAFLIKIASPEPANASVAGDAVHSMGFMLPFFQTIVARQIYEAWVRPIVEDWLGIEKAVAPKARRRTAR